MKVKIERNNEEKVYDVDSEEVKDMGIKKTNRDFKVTKSSYNFRGRLCGAMPIIATAVFLLLGFYKNMWHPAWLVFLSIPLTPIVLYAFDGKVKTAVINLTIIACVIAYLFLGFSNEMWGTAWVIFLLVPIMSILVPGGEDE